jgi:uncharacterized protein YndB with AHSA1/START domain
VYRYFTSSTLIAEWLCDVALATAHPGGRVYFGWNDGAGVVGNFTALLPGEKVGFTWTGTGIPGPGEVVVDLKQEAKGTRVALTHSWTEDGDHAARVAARWERGLENLASVMETGHDLRFTRRPMMGIMVDAELTAERAARDGIPVSAGVVIGGANEGMGAHAAGLTGGDVITSLGGAAITGFSSIAVALQPHRAGETVEVVFYRGAEEHRVPMTLSGRPIPEVPATAHALAAFVRQLFDWVDGELEACFEGADEPEAMAKPSPEEWSAREVVAHLLDGEGDYHAYITELVQGVERIADGPFENSDLRVRVTAGSYSGYREMLESYRRLEEQTVALLAGLPDEFVARKGSFWRLAYGYTQARPHYEEHFAQIRAAIASAR